MTDKKLENKLKEAEKNILQFMKDEEELEKEADDLRDFIFARLMKKNECYATINEVEFKIKIKYTDKFVIIAASDVKKFTILREKYKPFFISAQVDKEIGLEKTILGCVEAFVRKQYGIIKAEETD